MSPFINERIFQHKDITNALLKLNDAIIRHDNPPDEKLVPDFQRMFSDIGTKDLNQNKKTVEGITTSGDSFKVADELYHPTTDLFGVGELSLGVLKVDKLNEFEYPLDVYEDNSVRCTSVYRLRSGRDRVIAEIKNYHSLTVIDYTTTSLPYPILVIEELTSMGISSDGRLAHNRFADDITSGGRLRSMSFPRQVIYHQVEELERMIPTPEFYGVQTVHRLKEGWANDKIKSTGFVTSISFPAELITYRPRPDELTSTAFVSSMQWNWKD